MGCYDSFCAHVNKWNDFPGLVKYHSPADGDKFYFAFKINKQESNKSWNCHLAWLEIRNLKWKMNPHKNSREPKSQQNLFSSSFLTLGPQAIPYWRNGHNDPTSHVLCLALPPSVQVTQACGHFNTVLPSVSDPRHVLFWWMMPKEPYTFPSNLFLTQMVVITTETILDSFSLSVKSTSCH